MTAYTCLGAALWDWEPWTELSLPARVLWLALYTSAEAKRHVPGLWQGGIPSMADAARMQADDVVAALDELLVHEMVEYDQKSRVLRLCILPDAGEYPANGNVIRGWWTKFKTVPACSVRDAHVRTVAWILEVGASQRDAKVSHHHKQAWEETFGRVVVPAPRRRGVRRLADTDTSTAVQPSLFTYKSLPVASEANGSGNRSGNGFEIPWVEPPVDNYGSLRQLNKINIRETVPETVGDRKRKRYLGSSPEREIEGGHETRTNLELVPDYTVDDVLEVMRSGPWDPCFEKTHQDALSERIESWRSSHVTLDDFRVLAQYNAVFGKTMSARSLAALDVKASAIHARASLASRDERLAMLAEFQGKV